MVTPEQLSLVAGVLISLLAFYLPVIGPKYEALGSQAKAQVMGLAIIVVGAASYVLAWFCIGPLCLVQPVDFPSSLWQLGLTIFSALAANQGTYVLVRKLKSGTT
jgi:hypothetical protein